MSSKREVDFAVIQLISLVKIKAVVTQPEIDEICAGMDEKAKQKVLRKLRKRKIVMDNGLLQYSKEVIGDEEKRAKELRAQVSRKDPIMVTSDSLKMGPRVTEGIVATGFPETTGAEWLSMLTKEKENFDFTVYIMPSSSRPAEIYLTAELRQVEKELHSFVQKGLQNQELEKRKKDLAQKIDYIRQGKYKLFKMAMYILSKGVNEETAKKVSKKVMSAMHAGGIEGKFATNYQRQIFMSMMPTSIDRLEGRRIVVPATALAASFPFRKR